MTATSAPLRVCVYVRYSADMQSPRSCDDQIRECTAYAQGQGWEVVFVERDDAVRAGAIAGRAGYGRVVAAAQAGQFQVLLVEEHSRFSRDFWGGLAEVASLRKVGVRLADTKNGIVDADSAFGQLRLAFSLVTSQQETQRLGERSKRGLKGKVLQRFSGGGRPPYGYRRAPVFSEVEVDVDGRARRIGVRFEPDPAEGPVALRIFQMYAEGVSKHAIAVRFNREGIPTREAGTMRRGVPCSGTWCAATVKGVLENQVYVGTFYWNQTSRLGDKHAYSGKKEQVPNPEKDWVKVEDFVTPLVTPELWEQVQERLKKDRANFKRHHVAGETRRYLLSGLLRCADCGARYAIGGHRGVPPSPHYRCPFRAARGVSTCSNTTYVSQVALEARLKQMLEVVVKDPKRLAGLVKEHNNRVGAANKDQLATVRVLQARRNALEEERGRLVSAIALGKGVAKTLVGELEKREKELEEISARIAEGEGRVLPVLVPSIARLKDFVTGAAKLFTGDFDSDRKLLVETISGILVYPNGSLVVQFQEASLFEPMRFAQLPNTVNGQERDIARARAAARREVQEQRAEIERVAGKKALENLEMDVEMDADGNPAFIMMTAGVVKRSFGGAQGSSSRRSDEVAYVSPAGVEPALAT